MAPGVPHTRIVDEALRKASPSADDMDARRARAAVENRLFSGPPKKILVGRYRLQAKIGTGGMGAVYRAYDPELDRDVAVKLMNADAIGSMHAPLARARLVREARSMARLSDPHVIHVYDVGTVDDSVFIAMELVEGKSLANALATVPRPDTRTIVKMFLDAGLGLAAAHAANIVHRDFKPENVMVGTDARVRVGDFGLAGLSTELDLQPPSKPAEAGTEHVDEPLTRTGAWLGTPKYMAPEQESGSAPSVHSDQFSFCVALYEALYGRPPFEGTSLGQYRLNVRDGRLREPPTGHTQGAIYDVIVRGLAIKPEARHADMNTLLRRLEIAIADGTEDPQQQRRRLHVLATLLVTTILAAWFGWWFGQQPPAPSQVWIRTLRSIVTEAPPRPARVRDWVAARLPDPEMTPSVQPGASPVRKKSNTPRGPACFFQSDFKTHFRTRRRGGRFIRDDATCYECDAVDPAVYGLVPSEGKTCGRYFMCTSTQNLEKCPP